MCIINSISLTLSDHLKHCLSITAAMTVSVIICDCFWHRCHWLPKTVDNYDLNFEVCNILMNMVMRHFIDL